MACDRWRRAQHRSQLVKESRLYPRCSRHMIRNSNQRTSPAFCPSRPSVITVTFYPSALQRTFVLSLNVRPCLVKNYWNRFLSSQYVSMARNLKVKGDAREFLIDSSTSDDIEGLDNGNLRAQTTPQATHLVNRYQGGQRPADAREVFVRLQSSERLEYINMWDR